MKREGDYRKGGRKGFDGSITRLQKQCYVLISDFVYLLNKQGEQYGWGVAEYSTPELFFGKSFSGKVYKRTPEESLDHITKHFKKILPGVDEKILIKILKA